MSAAVPITLTTDFGVSSPYVGQMKGVVAGIAPQASIIDVTHVVPPQDVLAGACVLAEVHDAFPPGTIHVAVIDPGVGTAREILCARVNEHWYVLPDNGLLTFLIERHPAAELYTIDRPEFWRPCVTPTFHGRDIMAPVAAHLHGGVPASRLGTPRTACQQLDWPPLRYATDDVVGHIRQIDSFGNLITDIPARCLPANTPCRVHWRDRQWDGPRTCYGDSAPGTIIVLISSYGLVEIARVNGHAHSHLQARVGDEVRVSWSR